MPLKSLGVIEIPGGKDSEFDHAAFDPKTRRVFIAHTARDCLEVIDHDAQKHIATLPGFTGVAGAVADDGDVLTTNRGAASATWLDGATFETKAIFETGPRPNGAAVLKGAGIGIVACIGDDREGPSLHVIGLKSGQRVKIDLPGRPRWCVTDAAADRVFLYIRDPSMILTARLPDASAGFLNGLVGGASGLAGIVIVIWSALRGWPKDEQRAAFQPTGVATFLFTLIALGGVGGISPDVIKLFVAGLPVLAIGTSAGWSAFGKLDEARFRKMILVLLLLSGAALTV